MSWADIQLTAATRWLRGKVGSAVHFAAGITNEALGKILIVGIQARFPSTEQPDALPYIGRDRNLDQGPFESAASFATRCRFAFDTWSTAGHPRELLGAILAYLSPNAPILRVVGGLSIWDTLSSGVSSLLYASPANWNWDENVRWWRAWPIIYKPSFGPSPKWGAFKWGDGSTYGSGATSTQVRALRNIVRKWKPANVVVPNIIVSFDPTLFDPTQPAGGGINPDGQFGRPYKSNGTVAVATRPANTAFFGGAT